MKTFTPRNLIQILAIVASFILTPTTLAQPPAPPSGGFDPAGGAPPAEEQTPS